MQKGMQNIVKKLVRIGEEKFVEWFVTFIGRSITLTPRLRKSQARRKRIVRIDCKCPAFWALGV